MHRSKRKVNPPLLAGALGQGRVVFPAPFAVVLSYAYLLCIAGPMASPDGPDLLSYALVTNIGETAKTKYRRRVDERAIYGPFL